MLSVIVLNVIMLSVVKVNDIMLSAVKPILDKKALGKVVRWWHDIAPLVGSKTIKNLFQYYKVENVQLTDHRYLIYTLGEVD